MAMHSTAHYLLEGLGDVGIDHVFANLGTDHVSLIEALADWKRQGRPVPAMVLCPHENVAMHMAGGYAAMTGHGQAVLVHVDAGTANASMGLHNLFRSRLPVFLMAGKAPYTIHGELPGSRDNYVHLSRIRTISAVWCGRTSNGNTTCHPAWSRRKRFAAAIR